MTDSDYTYEPIGGNRKSRKKPKAVEQDAEGRVIEREPLPGNSFKKPNQPPAVGPLPPRPMVSKTCRQEILYVLRPDKQDGDLSRAVIDTLWRPVTEPCQKPLPSKPFVWEANTFVREHIDVRILQDILPHAGKAGDPPHRHRIPVASATLSYLLLECPERVYWADATDGGIRLRHLELLPHSNATLKFRVQQHPDFSYTFHAVLERGPSPQDDLSLSQVTLLLQGAAAAPMTRPAAYALCRSQLIHVNLCGACQLAQEFLGNGAERHLDYPDALAFAKRLAMETRLSTEDFPDAIAIRCEAGAPPVGELYVRTAAFKYKDQEQLHCELSFNYDGVSCPDDHGERFENRRSVVMRDAGTETRLRERLPQLGFRYNSKPYVEELGWKLLPSQLDAAVNTLVQEGWIVSAEGKTYRRPSSKQLSIKSGIDWFDVEGGVSFDGKTIPLPELLALTRNGQKSVRLDDGTYGVLPIEWLANFTVLTEIGDVDNDKIRFRAQQAALVAALLQDRLDEAAPRFQEQLAIFERLAQPAPAKPPAGFQATLRPYQELGLGWLLNMQKAGLGACLADDMGLGKTIQVLAVLGERARQPGRQPSLVVLPRSLIFNWQAEAAKFAPWLRVLVHLGAGRSCAPSVLNSADLVLTTYGTLRNDVAQLAKVDFDYCVLDESQAIKNADSTTARAVRCIKARYRIAMTGTPIENHLGELFSQLEFLNPGLFGSMKAVSMAPSPNNTKDDAPINRIRRGVRPFILRRRKQDVAKDLPPKTEQLLMCEMSPDEQQDYDDLRRYYQNELLDGDDKQSGMQILAALTRLRQAACHPGLLKAQKIHDSSAKLELLLASLETILAAGHKALVFSQFTSFLKIILARLEELGYGSCYLDGQTADRAAVVQEFQEKPDKQVFLISLKAGGVGLNLTAADYVFIMDPWWNPATEAQAIDRAYRIGQKNPVMAYRLVTKGTIEEKVVALQNQKRDLANAVIDQDAGLPAAFSRKDLEALLR